MIKFDVNKAALNSLSKKILKTESVKDSLVKRSKNEVEACGSTCDNLFEKQFSHPLIEALTICYNSHYPLTLSPDAIWMCIAQGFAAHVNKNAEDLRSMFVSHEGKKLIKLRRDNFVKGSPDNNWEGCFNEFSDNLAFDLGKKRDLIVSNFSTTGPIEKAASEVVLMNSMKAYYKYGMSTMCGIPSINLLGTVEDWENILVRASNLSEYKLEWWIKELIYPLEKIVETAKGNPDVEFWDNFYKLSDGSGGPYISGWVNTLFPYLLSYKQEHYVNKYLPSWRKDGMFKGPTTMSFIQGLSQVDFKWEYYETTYDMEFVGGMIGLSQDIETLAIKPEFGWAVRDKNQSRPGLIDPNEDW